jgi:hypothetical protein
MKYENRKTHNMIFLMLGHRFKSIWILSSFVGWEQGVQEIFISYVGQMSWTLASFDKLIKDIVLLGLQFGYFWANCKYKWTNRRACQERGVNF